MSKPEIVWVHPNTMPALGSIPAVPLNTLEAWVNDLKGPIENKRSPENVEWNAALDKILTRAKQAAGRESDDEHKHAWQGHITNMVDQ